MKVVGQNDVGKEMEGVYSLDTSQGILERVEVGLGLEVGCAVVGDPGDEDDGVWNVESAEVGHGPL